MTTERTIFLNALDRDDPGQRCAYLDAACAGNPALRQRVEALLRSHAQVDTFLEIPALDQITSDDQTLAILEPASQPNTLGMLDYYEVLEVVGRGSTGLVLKVRDTKLQRVVAIKMLAPGLAASPKARQRFVQEAQAAAAVRDDHVVAIYAVSDDGRVPYLVMEYIGGTTLQEKIKRQRPLELVEILRIGIQAAKGLAAAHAQGLIHRDIKPGNILLENSVQRVKITDFGLARAAGDAGPTSGGAIVGTPMFMSPEQARGETIGHRSDLFSLGSVLYTLCTGHPPFQGDNTAALLKCVCEETPRPIRELRPDVPEWLGELIVKLHARRANDRLASAQEVADLLGKQLALLQQPPLPAAHAEAPGSSLPAHRAPPKPLAGPSPQRRRNLWWGACLAVVLVLLAGLLAYWKPWQEKESENLPGEQKSLRPKPPITHLALRRESIAPRLLALAGGGDPAKAPAELAAVLGDGRFLLPHVGQTAWMAQSPDGKVLAVPLDDNVVLFETTDGKYLRSLPGPGGRVSHVTFSRDSQLLAATTRYEAVGGAVRVWDLRADRMLYTNPQPGPTVSGAAVFSADSKRLFTEVGGTIVGWDARSGRKIQTLKMPPGGISSMGFSPDGRRLAVANWTGCRVKFFDWTGDQLAETKAVLDHPWPVETVVFSTDGRFLASGDLTGFKLADAKTLKVLLTVETPEAQLAFTPDSRTLFAAQTTEQHKTVHTFTRWDVRSRKELPRLSVEVSVEPVRAFHRLSGDGKVLFLAPQFAPTYVMAIDTATGKELFPRRGHVAPLLVVAISPDGTTAASAGQDWVVKLWDLATGAVRHTLKAHTGAVYGLSFSPDGKRLASGSRDGTIAIWDVDKGTEVRALHGHSRAFSRIQFSPDGRTVSAGGEAGQIEFWDVASGKKGEPLHGHVGVVRCVAFNADGSLLATGGEDRAVILHDLARGRSQKLQAPGSVNDVAFSADGHTLAAVGDGPEPAVRLWDLKTMKATTRPGHAGPVLGVAFSPTAPLLATCAEDGTVHLWDPNGSAGLERTIGPGLFGGPVRQVAFTPDGRYLATANANGTIYLLKLGRVKGSGIFFRPPSHGGE